MKTMYIYGGKGSISAVYIKYAKNKNGIFIDKLIYKKRILKYQL